jgi:signal transduction histidine kinase
MTAPRTAPRWTVRVRLTLLYTGLFAACGAIVVAVTYALVASLQNPSASSIRIGAECQHPVGDLRTKCKDAFQEAAALGARIQREATLAHLLQYSLITLAAATLLAAAAGWIAAGRVLRPVQQITQAARAASEHNLSARVLLRGPRDELRELADTFDAMLARLQAAFEAQRRFIANAGHELRTPLTVMRTTLDVVLDKPAASPGELRRMGHDVRAAVDHAERLIGALLTLARSDRGLTACEPVDLATVAEDVLDATDRGDRRLHASLKDAMTSGDPVLLERMVANLVDNALRYNTPGGDLWLTTSTVNGQATLAVANTGPVIARPALGVLFEPFQRLNGRTGSDGFGLGLAIVASITTAHHGTLTAEPRPHGGLTVTVTMPRPTG